MRRALAFLLIAFLGLGAGFIAGCGDDTKVVTDTGKNGQTTVKTVADVKFAKTKFVLHMGLAYGAFSRYIKNPYQRGAFKSGAPKRKRAIVKAALAGAFSYRELKLARRSAESSEILRTKLLGPFDKVLDQFGTALAGLKDGKLPTDLGSLIGGMAGLKSLAAGAGFDFDEKIAPIPGL